LNSRKRILFLGCGDIAKRVAARLSDSNHQMVGLRRSKLATHGIQMHAGDCCDPLVVNTLIDSAFDVVVVTMTPTERSEAGYRQSYYRSMEVLLASINQSQHKPPLVIFVSSTSVYGQNNGEWVDETSATEPTSFSGRVLLEAESLLRQSGVPHCIVRFSGIYGPGRIRLIERVKNGVSGVVNNWTNRIHSEDCANFLQRLILIDSSLRMPLYLATDSMPALSGDVEHHISELLAQEATREISPPSRIDSGKRCSNQRVLNSGFNFKFCDYRAGYRSLISENISNLNCLKGVIE
jgi:nucleoside-diphosphate-sugar epimerase